MTGEALFFGAALLLAGPVRIFRRWGVVLLCALPGGSLAVTTVQHDWHVPWHTAFASGNLARFHALRPTSFVDIESWELQYDAPKVMPVVVDDGRSVSVPLASLVLCLLCAGFVALALRSSAAAARVWGCAAVFCAVAGALLRPVAAIDVKNPFAGPPSDALAAQIATRVLANASAAFQEKDSREVNRALKVVVAGGGFSDIAGQLKRVFAIELAGGGRARVDRIEDFLLENTYDLAGAQGFRVLANWTARAEARRWGQADRRAIRCRALIEFAEVGGIWKLVGLTIIDASPLD